MNLVDEINIDDFIKEASVALEDDALLRDFVKEKATIAIERFLDYIPKMSIPVEKRDLPDGWTITCRASDGGHLKLNDLVIKVSATGARLISSRVTRKATEHSNIPCAALSLHSETT